MNCALINLTSTCFPSLQWNSSIHLNPFIEFCSHLFHNPLETGSILPVTIIEIKPLKGKGRKYLFRFNPLIRREFSMSNSTLLSNSKTVCPSILFFCRKSAECFLYNVIFFFDQVITSTSHKLASIHQSIAHEAPASLATWLDPWSVQLTACVRLWRWNWGLVAGVG
jgi:hypothetical protein